MSRKIEGSVVVITGASSGIGRATALEFARRGANVVVAARREEPLESLVGECQGAGAQAIAVPTDVRDLAAVEALAAAAVDRFGRLDVWVNNAAVTVFGRFEDTPMDAIRQVIETNLFGYMHGARAALPHFRRAGEGVLINNASVTGKVGAPYLSTYSTSKFAIVGFGEALRQELLLSGDRDIKVSTILPAAIDTPFYQHAANYTGRAPKPLNPTYAPEDVARAIVACAENPRREMFVGNVGVMLTLTRRLSPRLYEQMYARQVDMDHFQDAPAPNTPGNVFQPMAEGTETSGGWKGSRVPGRWAGIAGRGRFAAAGVAGAASAVVGLAWLRSRGSAGSEGIS